LSGGREAMATNSRCKICNHDTRPLGLKRGKFLCREFHFVSCEYCGFVAITDPCTDYAALYDERYYRGEGADPLVNYAYELDHPDETVRIYEWRGIVTLLRQRVGNLADKRWLDYGCGAGGLVRYAKQKAGADCVGFDTGGFTDRARARGIPILSESSLATMQGQFDIVTMVEVIEHVADPITLLQSIAALLRRGGLLFLTTGNALPQLKSFLTWAYVVPEIHISYFTPRSLEIAYEKAGLTPVQGGYGRGWNDIIQFKILKNLGRKRRSYLESALPWPLLSRLADARYGVTSHPLAVKS
jgi:SAM-dependent methyltransferase